MIFFYIIENVVFKLILGITIIIKNVSFSEKSSSSSICCICILNVKVFIIDLNIYNKFAKFPFLFVVLYIFCLLINLVQFVLPINLWDFKPFSIASVTDSVSVSSYFLFKFLVFFTHFLFLFSFAVGINLLLQAQTLFLWVIYFGASHSNIKILLSIK